VELLLIASAFFPFGAPKILCIAFKIQVAQTQCGISCRLSFTRGIQHRKRSIKHEISFSTFLIIDLSVIFQGPRQGDEVSSALSSVLETLEIHRNRAIADSKGCLFPAAIATYADHA